MRLLVRSWNVFHGRTSPETRHVHVEVAVRRISTGDPDIVCLQELPVWSLPRLHLWSGAAAFASVAMPPLGGPFARRLTDLAPGLLRSALTGQANATLISRRLTVGGHETLELNPRWFRRRAARQEGLTRSETRDWARNRRVAQVVRVGSGDDTVVVANLHLTSPANCRAAELELERVVVFAESFASPGEPIALCGDLNLTASGSRRLQDLGKAGFSPPSTRIDHILVRGLDLVQGPEEWPDSRRRLGEVLLSDHAPLEAAMIRP